MLFAVFFSRRHVQIARVRNLLVSFLYFALPAFLIIIQPDLGTTMILFGIWLSFLLVSGVRWRHLLAALLIFALIAAVAWIYFLKDYQKTAFSACFFPSAIRWESITTLFNQKSPSVRRGFSVRDSDRGRRRNSAFCPRRRPISSLPLSLKSGGCSAGFWSSAPFASDRENRRYWL